MIAVGIKELKAKLSGYLNETRKGVQILVTDHGEEIALITPLSNEYVLMMAIEKSGKARWSRGKPEGLAEGITVKGEGLSTTILEKRE
jgi:prevent-host-death family protein